MAEEETGDVLTSTEPEAADTTAEPKKNETAIDEGADGKAQQSADGDVLADADGADDEGVPDQYTLDFEELGIKETDLREGVLEEFQSKAKELGLTQKQFHGLAQFDIERTQAADTEAVDAWNSRVADWKQSARTDREFGGDRYDANVKTALSAVEKFGDGEFKALLKSPSEDNPEGLAIGNHPAVLRFLNRIGKMLADPEFVAGQANTAPDTSESRLRRLYPTMFKDSA